MNYANPSNYQLFELIHNEKLDSAIRKGANDEFDRRGLSKEQLEEIIRKHEAHFSADKEERLEIHYNLLLIVCP